MQPIPKELVALIQSEVASVLEDSEASTLAVGSHLSEIVLQAEEFVTQLQKGVGVIGASGKGSISHTLDLQGQSMDAFIATLVEVIGDNVSIADRVIDSSGTVAEAAQSISDVASQARMLCFNTKIEAGRLGDLGRPFMVIADQMRELSTAIAVSNDQIATLTEALTPLLHEVKSSVGALQGQAQGFALEYAEHKADLHGMTRKLQGATAESIQVGDEKLARIIERSGESIVALQTQDLISQRLGRILQETREYGDAVEELGGVGFMSDDLGPGEEGLTSGEMELF